MMMLRFQWNALRIGDEVTVHDDSNTASTPVGGTVALVERHASFSHDSDVVIRIPGRRGVIRPRKSAVHLTNGWSAECWRCQQLAEPAARSDGAPLRVAGLAGA